MKPSYSKLINLFAEHRVAANLIMMVMILAGCFALLNINTQFFPSFDLKIIQVSIAWPGANAEDVESSITTPLEQELRRVNYLKKITSTSNQGRSMVTMEFQQNTDMSTALNQVRELVSQVRNLPEDSERPAINRVEQFEAVAKIALTGGSSLRALRPLAFKIERELLDAGISKISFRGLPDQQISIEVSAKKLSLLGLTLPQLANQIKQQSRNIPAGNIGKDQFSKQLRAIEEKRTVSQFMKLPLINASRSQRIILGDIAKVRSENQSNEVLAYYDGKPAIILTLLRASDFSALTSANILQHWLTVERFKLGSNVQVHVYDQRWILIKERINLLMKNGLGGLILIIGILFLFLNFRIAWWVIIGIPTSFFAALGALYFFGGTINMVSLFAIIMALGIIVDDTIVVSEETLTQLSKGKTAIEAVNTGAFKMLAPVLSSSLTTICAFLPLFLVGGVIGTILFDIPLVIICVILASVIECFLVLPGHLFHSLKKHDHEKSRPLRLKINTAFDRFKNNHFKRAVIYAIHYRAFTITLGLGLFIIAIAIVKFGLINFTFFPNPEGRLIYANVQFNAGTPVKQIQSFMRGLEKSARQTSVKLSPKDKPILTTLVRYQNRTITVNSVRSSYGEQYAALELELVSPDSRKVSNIQFINRLKENIQWKPGIENFSIGAPRAGPPGLDIEIQLSGRNINHLKEAGHRIMQRLAAEPGVFNISDNVPYGQNQLIYSLKPEAKALGLSLQAISDQLRAAYNGILIQVHSTPNDEIEVRLSLPDSEKNSFTSLDNFPIITGKGVLTPLGNLVSIRHKKGFDIIHHTNVQTTLKVIAEVNANVNNENVILNNLSESFLPALASKYNLKYTFEGRSEEQSETLNDMLYGLILGLILIFIILAWFFESYAWPLVVMLAIPLGLTGAIFGHLIMGLNLTLLSLFGFFGLSGIVVNDSIILLNTFKKVRPTVTHAHKAIVIATTMRLRAVILTSLTTIAGLLPLLFERSLQAQFLIPMAASISFGLAYATLLILFVIPALMSVLCDVQDKFKKVTINNPSIKQ